MILGIVFIPNTRMTPSENCPLAPLLVMLQGKWKNQVLYELCVQEPVRFEEIKKKQAVVLR